MRTLKDLFAMFVISFSCVLISKGAAAQATTPSAPPRIYKSWHGDMSISLLEKIISEKYHTPAVAITGIRWALHPLNYVMYFESRLMKYSYAFYVVTMNIGSHQGVKLDLTLNETTEAFALTSYDSQFIELDWANWSFANGLNPKMIEPELIAVLPYASIGLKGKAAQQTR